MTSPRKEVGKSDDDARLDRLEAAVRQLYELESRFKPAKFASFPMPDLQAIVEGE